MNITEYFENDKTVQEVLASFMEAIEEWQSEVEGSGTPEQIAELDILYDTAEVKLRYIINHDNPPKDEL